MAEVAAGLVARFGFGGSAATGGGGFGNVGGTGKKYNLTATISARNAFNHVNFGTAERHDQFALLRRIDHAGGADPAAVVRAADSEASGSGGRQSKDRDAGCDLRSDIGAWAREEVRLEKTRQIRYQLILHPPFSFQCEFDRMTRPARNLLASRLQIRGAEASEMLHWSLIFLVIAIIAGILGFTGIAGAAMGIAKFLFFLFLVIWLIVFFVGSGKQFKRFVVEAPRRAGRFMDETPSQRRTRAVQSVDASASGRYHCGRKGSIPGGTGRLRSAVPDGGRP